MAAQIWFEVRRAGWTLPAATLLLWVISSGALWLYLKPGQHPGQAGLVAFRNYSSVFIFVSFFLATFIHGMRTRVVGFGRNVETSGYEWMQPLTSAEFARARIVSHALVFLPTLLLVTAVNFALIWGHFLTSFVPEALAMGTASLREVVWVVLSRAVLLGIVAWMFVAAGTRLLRASAALAFLIVLVLVTVSLLQEINLLPKLAGASALWAAITLFLIYHVGLTGVIYTRMWKKGEIPLRSLVAWGGIWAITTWFIYYATLFKLGESPGSAPPLWDSLIASLAYASLIVLPYPAILADVSRRRHGATPDQDPAQHERTPRGALPNSRVGIRIMVAAIVAFVLWIGWPAKPAYEAVWRRNGYPVTLAELDAWYKQVPEDENVALKYSDAYKNHQAALLGQIQGPNREGLLRNDYLLIVGTAELQRAEPISRYHWQITEEYWGKVTSPIASRLKEIAASPSRPSRYPIDLLAGHSVNLEHLSKLRNLARELSLDALHWTLADKTGEATASIRAIFPIAKSLSEEPILISQFIRFGILSIAASATETTMNRALLTDTDLARITEAIDLALTSPDEPMMLRRGIIGESVLGLNMIGSHYALDTSIGGETRALLQTFSEVIAPSGASRIVLATRNERSIRAISKLSLLSDLHEQWRDEDWTELVLFARLASGLAYSMDRAVEGEWRVRMQLEVTRTALAVERYRLAHGTLPENLEALVPAFLPSIPDDAFAEPGQPIQYRYTNEGEFVVYSIGRDKKDDGGEENTRKGYERDITFTVAPLDIRTRAQIAP